MRMKAVAVITARGGSKRIPRKNIKAFLGQPIIKYSIDAALKAECFDEVMVSTDDAEIADIAVKFGAAVPFIRSDVNSDDYAMTADVIEEVLKEYEKLEIGFEYCCCIYPTAPFITAGRLHEGYSLLINSGADSVLPVVRFSYPIQRALKIDNDRILMIWPENLNKRSQDLMSAYHDAGQFYWLKVSSFLNNKKLLTENTCPLEISETEMQDIDNEEDWKLAELKYRMLRGL